MSASAWRREGGDTGSNVSDTGKLTSLWLSKYVHEDIPSLPSDDAIVLRDRAVAVCAAGGEDVIVGGVAIGLRCGSVLGGSPNELRVRFLVKDSRPPIDGKNMPEWRSGKSDIGDGT